MLVKFLKSRLFSAVATFAVFVAAAGVQPASVLFFYQPDVPEHLTN